MKILTWKKQLFWYQLLNILKYLIFKMTIRNSRRNINPVFVLNLKKSWRFLDDSNNNSSVSPFLIQLAKTYLRLRLGHRIISLSQVQCDQMARLFPNICGHSQQWKFAQLNMKICQSEFKIEPNTKWTLSKWPKIVTFATKWRNFANFGHTVFNARARVSELVRAS